MSTAAAKVRYQPGTARNQKRQIGTNRRAIERLQRRQQRHLVYCDWQLNTQVTYTNNQWFVLRLLDFDQWRPVLRQDATVQRSSHTFVKYMKMQCRFLLNDCPGAYLNFFLVTPRRAMGPRDFAAQPLVIEDDYIVNPQSAGSMIQLNSGVFKVHYHKYVTLTKDNLQGANVAGENVGNPNTTWRKWELSQKLNIPVSIPYIQAPQVTSWLSKPIDELPYWSKFQVLVYITHASITGLAPVLETNVQFVTTNTD